MFLLPVGNRLLPLWLLLHFSGDCVRQQFKGLSFGSVPSLGLSRILFRIEVELRLASAVFIDDKSPSPLVDERCTTSEGEERVAREG